jgi:hypothetical protein
MQPGPRDQPTGGPPRTPDPSFAPPRFTDPRRLGAAVGLVGAFVFVHAYAPLLGDQASRFAVVGGYLLITAALVRLLGLPRWLGTFVVPRTGAVATYLACVVGELALLRIGSLWLTHAGREEARPALIAAVVGLHFIPFAWAFGEPMFTWLGATLLVLGAAGLTAELTADVRAAPWAAVASGWAMALLLLAYASGAFARPRVRPGESSRPGERGS